MKLRNFYITHHFVAMLPAPPGKANIIYSPFSIYYYSQGNSMKEREIMLSHPEHVTDNFQP